MRLPALLLGLLFALAPLAGCLGGEVVPDERRFTASGGAVSHGWAYDGAGLVPAGATLEGLVNNPQNTGIVNVSFEWAGSRYVVTFDTFAQAEGKDFQDGGIAFDLDEHGDTGVADASIPRILAVVAAWGSARVERDGALATSEPWVAHLMVSADTVRGADGKIAKADGTTPYDPATPGDARRVEGDPQALFFVKHPQGESFARAPMEVAATLACQGPECAQEAELAVEAGKGVLALNATVAGPSDQLPVGPLGQGRLAIVDAAGTELASVDVSPSPAMGGPVTLPEIPLQGALLPLRAQLTGEGAFHVHVSGSATYDEPSFLVVTWDEVTLS